MFTRPSDSALPPDLLRDASRRVGFACLSVAGIYAVSLLVGTAWGASPYRIRLQALGLALSLGVFGLSRVQRVSAQRLLDTALLYEIAVAFLTGLLEDRAAPGNGGLQPSWICVLVVAFAGMIPTSPTKTLTVAFTAATMGPLAFALRPEGVSASLGQVTLMFLGNYLAAAVALAPSTLISGLGRRAREMGSYTLEKRLGQGGMGEVWLASHRVLARPAAVKMIQADTLGTDPATAREILLRFQREARATAALRSPHTVTLYDFGLASEGVFYYVMEYLDGLDLETLVERFGPVPPERAVHFLKQACDSLAEAHAAGMVHRDIKPANLVACKLGLMVDVVKVLDFGLVTAPPEEQAMKLTGPATVFGTPAFMSPEQAGAEPVDARSDLYSLGCVAYWLLTGRLVFTGKNDLRTTIDLFRTAPEPPSKWAVENLPAALDEAVVACLAKDPADRPQSALEFAAWLEGIALPPWTQERARTWWRTRPL